MMNLVKVKDHPNLYRDANSKAIVILDTKARSNYLNTKTLAVKNEQSVEQLSDEIKTLKNDVNDIKQLLFQLINK
jgi:hypothetical protein